MIVRKDIPAFPIASGKLLSTGMTLRDYFAAQSIEGVFAVSVHSNKAIEALARDAYTLADAMLKARESAQ